MSEHVFQWGATHYHKMGAFPLGRKGQSCRVVARGALGSILVEFPDGQRLVTGRYAVSAPAGTAT